MKTQGSITILLWITAFLCIQENVNSLLLQPPQTRRSGASNVVNNEEQKVPFIVQQLKGQPSKSDCDAISSLVISVFFREEAERLPKNRSGGSITKPFILAYLKNLQYGDVKGKRYMLPSGINNSMFVARRIVPATTQADTDEDNNNSESSDINGMSIEDLLDPSNGVAGGLLYNKDILPPSEFGYKTEDVLGFVDVTEKNFGLSTDDNSNVIGRKTSGKQLRPVLTNLSVLQDARCSGVGSALVDACENIVMEEWTRKYYEMVLEVEEENEGAQRFYERRGYKALFSDPTSRRYDTSGLLLSNVRTTKICYQKNLIEKGARRQADTNNGLSFQPGMFFAQVRKAVGLKD